MTDYNYNGATSLGNPSKGGWLRTGNWKIQRANKQSKRTVLCLVCVFKTLFIAELNVKKTISLGNPCSIFFSNLHYFEDCVVLQSLWYNLPRSLFLSEELNFQQKLKTSLWWIACVTSVSVRFRWEKEEQGSKTARWKPKIPFHGLFLLRNQTETLATQLFDQKLGWIK